MADISSIEVSGPFPEGMEFVRLTGGDEISRPFQYDLQLLLPSAAGGPVDAAKPADILGKMVTVKVTSKQGDRFFSGIVDEFGVSGVAAHEVLYFATLRPWIWLLSKTRDNRIFQNMSVVEIVEEVFGAYSDAAFEKRLQGNYPQREYCVQYDESDLDFVQRLLEHEGIWYYFEQADGEHRMILTDAVSALVEVPGYEEVPFLSKSDASSVHGEGLRSWRRTARVVPGAYAQTDYDFVKPSADLMSKSEQPLGNASDDGEVYAYPGTYTVLSRGDDLSDLRREELQAPAHTVEAGGDALGLWAGAKFTLAEHPLDSENVAYAVLRTDYRFSNAQYDPDAPQTALSGGVAYVLQPVSASFRPARITRKPAMKGPQTAVVVGPAGEEIFTDEYARVKVQFHWDRKGARDEASSCFVRVSSAWAGAGWGFIQIPRIGQEVIVDFLEGDPDQPIITGRVYNAEQMPPYGLPGNATQSGWKSNSSPGGGGWNELRFEDKKGSEEVYFQAEKDHTELVKNNETRTIGNDWVEDVGHDATQSVANDRTESVGNDKSTTVGNNRTVSIGVDDSETVGSNRSLTVGSDETISVGANSTESIGANHKQSVGGNQSLSVGASRTRSVGAAEAVTVRAAQQITVGAARNVTVGAEQVHTIAKNDTWAVGADQSVTISANQSMTVGDSMTVSIAKNQATNVGEAHSLTVGKTSALQAGENMAVKVGKNIVIEAGDSIVIKTGKAAISMKKDGTITIEGKDVTVKGSGKINMKASSDVTIKGSKINQN
jgi:type VI secretion system secreted protein VgrG